ncbi:MAG: ABC transporter substrate-binding protein [Asticcacaulis sp.]
MITLKGMTWDHPRGYACLEAASKLSEVTQGIRVEWERRSLQAFADVPIAQLAKQYDFIVLDHPHVGQIADSGCLLPLPEPEGFVANSMGGSAESYVYNDVCWAYAIDAACQMAAYRPDMAGPLPLTWEAFLGSDAKAFRAVTPLKPVDAFDMLLTLAASRGDTEQPFSSSDYFAPETGLLGLKILKALYRLGPSEAVGWNPIQVLELLSTTDEFACSPCLFGYINYARNGFRPNRLGYFDLPVFEGMDTRRAILGGAGLGVSAQTADPAVAIAYANWLASEAVQSGVYVENEGQPAHRQTWQKLASDPRWEGFLGGGQTTISTAWTRPRSNWFLHYVDEVCEIFPNFFIRDINEQTFLDSLNGLFRHPYKDR